MLLQRIRDHAQGWFAYTIIALLIVPFAVWGIESYFEGGGPTDVAVVGEQKIPQQEFQRAYQQQRQRIQEMLGAKADTLLADTARLKQGVLKQLIDERVQHQFVREQKLRVSDVRLRDAVLALPIFQKSGFDPVLYDRVLRNQGYSAASFEESMRQSLATEQLRDGITDSAFATQTDLENAAALLKQQREVQYVVLKLSDAAAKITVDDAAIAAHFEKNKADFVKPEQVRVQFIELKRDQIAESITPSEDELKAAYQDQQDKYGRPEQRTASHILVTFAKGAAADVIETARKKAQQIADSIHSGGKPFDQALQEAKADTAAGVEGGPLGAITKKMFDDPAFENALYALQKAGDVSAPVRMPSGFHIIRLDTLTPAEIKPFDEVRALVANNFRQQQAETRLYEQGQTLATLGFEHPDDLETVAKAVNATIQESDWFSRKGGVGIAAQTKVMEAAFSEDVLKRGINSAPIELESGHVVMLRVKAHQEAVPQTLAEAHDAVVKVLRDQQAKAALAKVAEGVKAAAAQGTHLLTLAQTHGGTFKNAGLITREDGTVQTAIAEAAFRLPTPDAGTVALGTAMLPNGDQAVLEVFRVVSGKKEAVPEAERNLLAHQQAQQLGSGQFEKLLASQRTKTTIVTHNDRL